MTDFKPLYFKLFSAAADAVDAIDACNYGQAREILIRAQQEAEQDYLEFDAT